MTQYASRSVRFRFPLSNIAIQVGALLQLLAHCKQRIADVAQVAPAPSDTNDMIDCFESCCVLGVLWCVPA